MYAQERQHHAPVNSRDDATRPAYAFSVDVEDYFQVWAFSGVIDRSSWDGFAPRVGAATRRTLDMLDRHGVKATFFTLGWAAERDPDLIRDIVARGHELASHGYDHRKVSEMNPEQFREDVSHTKKLLEDVSGASVAGYRAPGFSIDSRTPWAYDVLADAGYLYSSSSHPIAHDHYGDPTAPRSAYRPLNGGAFVEAPVATAEVFGKRISCGGGGWFRASPYALTRRLLLRAEATLTGPVVFYFHPWEIDPGQPRICSGPIKSRLRHYFNLAGMEAKLDRLLSERPWGRIDAALGFRELRAVA